MVDNWETDGRLGLGDSGSSGLEGSVNLCMNGVVGESSVKNPVKYFPGCNSFGKT